MVKKILKVSKIFILLVVGALTFIYFSNKDKYVVPIMMYHHINYAKPMRANTVSPETFRAHMEYIRKKNYQVITLDQLVEGIKSKQVLNRKAVVITLDDGYADNYIYAYPVLKEFGFPATIFIPTDHIDTPGHLTWGEVKEMSRNGIAFESHTRNHMYLPEIQDHKEKLSDEVVNSKRLLEAKLGKPVKYFCYPSGGFSDEIKQAVKEAGYQAAFTTNRGYDRYNQDLFELKRIRFSDDKPEGLVDLVMWGKLSGYYNSLRKPKPPY